MNFAVSVVLIYIYLRINYGFEYEKYIQGPSEELSPGHITSLEYTDNTIFRPPKEYQRIIGGVESPIKQFPYVAVLTEENDVFCGGSIISSRGILTAAHCLADNDKVKAPEKLAVHLGSSTAMVGAKYKVRNIVIHPLYRDRNVLIYYYDIGILFLKSLIKFGNVIKKILIAPNYKWRNEKYNFVVAGFGLTENLLESSKLKSTNMRYVSRKACESTQMDSNLNMPVPDHMFCMISDNWSSDCFGDSGSGVIWRGYLVGMVALGRSEFCGSNMIPSMYTDVVFFYKWIKAAVKNSESNFEAKRSGNRSTALSANTHRWILEIIF